MNPAMLLIDITVVKMIQIIVTSFVGIFGVAAALNGFLFKNMNIVARVLILVAGVMMMDPQLVTDIIGISAFCAVIAWQYLGSKKEKAVPAV